MAEAAAAPPRPKMSLWTIASFGAAFAILFNSDLRETVGKWTGFLLDPLIGFGGNFPVLTIILAGALVVIVTTLVRHFTTDWLELAKMQAYMRAFNQERMKATKENNTYKLKVLNDRMPDLRAQQQRMSAAQMKQMPLTMLVSIPIFAWILLFLAELDYTNFAAPWNPSVTMFGTEGILFGSSVFPHWILLQIALTIPFGFIVQRIMKYIAWRERWQKVHPEVHE
jgi:uncharacterized membrane protein (DUF106 family)